MSHPTSLRRYVPVLLAFTVGLSGAATPKDVKRGVAKKPAGVRTVRVEVLPGEKEKLVDPALAEPIPVAVLGSPTLEVRQVDPSSLSLGGAAATKAGDGSASSYRDVDGDGREDLVFEVLSSRIQMAERGSRVYVTGRTLDGEWIGGSTTLRTMEGVKGEHRRALRTDPAVEKLPPLHVAIDILPGEPSNRIELGNRGTIDVAILSTQELDATLLDPATIDLAGAPATRRKGHGLAEVSDVNGDGLDDLIVEFPKRFLHLRYGDTEAILRALGPGGRMVEGSDRVQIDSKATMIFDSAPPALDAQPTPEFMQTAGITINDAAAATPYPSPITVSGVPGVISKVRVTLKGLTHSYPADIDILLVGPTGQSLILMSDTSGGPPGPSNVNLTFDDDAGSMLNAVSNPDSWTYRPLNIGGGDVFPAPAPAPSNATGLSVFKGTSPNGTWSLYVVDDLAGDTGSIAGWSVDFVTATEICNTTPIALFDNSAAAPYPSPINVAGLPTAVSKVAVKLKGLSHTFPQDIDLLLVGPGGQKALVMSDVGGTTAVSGLNLMLDDSAGLSLDTINVPVNATYQPVDAMPGDTFPGLAPPGPYQSALAQFNGSNPNGFWYLYALDDAVSDSGSLSGGWCLDITALTPDVHSNPTFLSIPNGQPTITSGQASVYPSQLQVSGIEGFIAKATVTLNGLGHTYPQDLDILLVAPDTTKVMLMSDVGGAGPGVSGVSLTFDDDAAPIPTFSNPASGTYAPSNDDSGGADSLPFPAPSGPYNGFMTYFTFANPNGNWWLYINDDAGGDVGYLSGGWTLTIQTYLDLSTSHPPFNFCNTDGIQIPSGAPSTTQGRSFPYPQDRLITGFPSLLDHYKVVVDLYHLTHSFPSDLDILLQWGTGGPAVLLMSDAGGIGPGMSNVNLTFDDDAAAFVPTSTPPASGVYRPTDINDGFADNFPDPCPPSCIASQPTPPFSTSLSAFKGLSSAAFWLLWIMDDAVGDTGSLQAWCLRFIPNPPPGEVQSILWSNASTLTWDAAVSATSYNLYRGDPSQLSALSGSSVDSCPRATTLTQQVSGLSEVPALGSWYWYLVRGHNAEGDGPAGFSWIASQSPARIHDSSGVACP